MKTRKGYIAGNRCLACELDDPRAMNRGQCARHYDQAAIRTTREGGDGALDLGDVAQVDRAQLHPKRRRRGLNCAQLADPADIRRTKNRRRV